MWYSKKFKKNRMADSNHGSVIFPRYDSILKGTSPCHCCDIDTNGQATRKTKKEEANGSIPSKDTKCYCQQEQE
jgi:hypothetical protein